MELPPWQDLVWKITSLSCGIEQELPPYACGLVYNVGLTTNNYPYCSMRLTPVGVML
eukprot:NODE_9257_length_266_cov_68.451613_g8516_i0.p1 GENE.NODE_9257_length_266_cov_68.451613_g8516_i0~~NODE_9257_length_266_cov_68.451613_g8516_i0.p1  ORF type:complete len:57 (+),score=7.95 NODE_9257_length_266_cov_68.451613_g8516_i0:60-230(+)